MYFDPNAKWCYFSYKKEPYQSGTTLIYNGSCNLNGENIVLNNHVVTFLYKQNGKAHFQDNNKNIYTCQSWDFEKRIIKIIKDPNVRTITEVYFAPPFPSTPMVTSEFTLESENKTILEPVDKKEEIYWTNDMVAKTLWYVIIMLAAVIFKDCIGIWILATIIWYNSTFKNKK